MVPLVLAVLLDFLALREVYNCSEWFSRLNGGVSPDKGERTRKERR